MSAGGQTNRVLILEKVEGVEPFRKFSDPSSKKTNSEKKNEEEGGTQGQNSEMQVVSPMLLLCLRPQRVVAAGMSNPTKN